MYVTVSLKIDLDARASVSEMERQIQQAGRAALQAALALAIRQQEEQQQCPTCGSQQVRTQGTKRRVLLTSFGRVEVALRRLCCRDCGHRFRPAEPCLVEVSGHNITPDLREVAGLVGSSWPYETAADVLHRLSGVQLSDERLLLEQGSALARQQHEQAEQVLQEAVNMAQVRAEREQPHCASKQEQLEWLQVGLDGGWIPSREQKGGMEGKIGVVASQVEMVGKRGRHRLAKRRYVATFGSADELGQLTYAAACELEATEASRQVVLLDGADWINAQTNEHFPEALKILDWPHLWRKMQQAVRSLQPGNRASRRAWRKQQYEVLLPRLGQGQREAALAHLESLRPASGEVPAALEEAMRYLQTQADWLSNYQSWQEQGYPICSGLVERTVAVVINVRMNKRGMRWKRRNAPAVVALRVQRINADWEAAVA